MKRIGCCVVVMLVLLGGIGDSWANDMVDKALQAGSQALVGQEMDKAIDHFNRAKEMGDSTRTQLVSANSGLCASRYKQSMMVKDPSLTRMAIADCDAAISLKSDHQSSYRIRGIAYLTLGILDRSIEDLNVAAALDPADYLAVQNRGLAKAKMGHSEAAISDFDLSIKLNPKHPWGYYNRGRLHGAFYRHKKAIDDFSTFIRFKPGFEPVYLHRGRSRMLLGHYQQAVGDFYEAIRLKGGNNPLAMSNRGIALYLLGRYGEAEQDFLGVVKLDPSDTQNRFWLYLVRGRLQRPARETFTEAGATVDAKSWPGSMAAYLLGHAEAQSVLDLIRETKDPLKRAERESLALFLFGEWAAVRGRNEVAIKWFDIIVNKAGPKPPWYHAAKQQAKLLKTEGGKVGKQSYAAPPLVNKTAAVTAETPKPTVPKVGKSVEKSSKTRISKNKYPHKPGTYAFKMASFKDLSNADQALAEATELGYGVYLQEIVINGETFLRVWVGPFNSMEEANAAREMVMKIPGRHPSKARKR